MGAKDVISLSKTRAGKRLPQYVAAISVCLGSIATGTVAGWPSNILEELKNAQLNGIQIDDNNLGWIGSLGTLGAMTSCFAIGILCDKLGRKLATILLTIPFTIGWLLIIFANSVEMLYAGRYLTGLAGGAFCVAAPLYTSEIAEVDIRGTLGAYFQLFSTIGVLFAFVLAYFVEIYTYSIILAVVPLAFCVAFFFQPETPVYLMKQGNETKARQVLTYFRGHAYDINAELKSIKAFLEHSEKNSISLRESLKTRNTKIAALVCFSLMFFQQWCGIEAVLSYTSDIFGSSNSELDPKLATIIVGCVQVVATFVSSAIVDLLGRRILLLLSDSFMAISGILLGVYFSLKDRNLADTETIESIGLLPVVALSIFIVAFSAGFGPVPWIMASELFPDGIKGIASAFASTFNRCQAFIITKFYLDMKNTLGGDSTFYLFSLMSIIGTIFVFAVVPETKGKTLEQIQLELNGSNKIPEETIKN